jgi:hypothetical protein
MEEGFSSKSESECPHFSDPGKEEKREDGKIWNLPSLISFSFIISSGPL